MNEFPCFSPKYLISAQFGYNFSRQTDSGAGIACFCHSLVTALGTSGKADNRGAVLGVHMYVNCKVDETSWQAHRLMQFDNTFEVK